ncbi:MAG: hypothetical protein JXA90_11480, partial [Planctomycetes bacterium]|nr:hypothetical protein [Planctomycetota bacterium]
MPEIEATVKHAGALRPAAVEGCIAGWIERLPLGAIARQRWFAGKGREVEGCRPLDLVAIGGEEPAGWICLLEVRFADSTRDTYHLPLAWSRTEEEAGREPARQPAFRVLVESDNGRFSIHPPAPGEPFWAHLLGAWRRGEELPGRRGHILLALARSPGERTAQEGALGRAAGSRGAIVRPLDENQSNTSLVIDETSLLKIYRRVEPGPHPEVELCRFLDEETGFRGTPAVEGWMEYRGDDGRAWSMAMAQRFVAGGVDGWSALLGELRSAAEPAAGRWSLALPERLGELTADLHLALAACGPEPELASRAMSAEDIDALRR